MITFAGPIVSSGCSDSPLPPVEIIRTTRRDSLNASKITRPRLPRLVTYKITTFQKCVFSSLPIFTYLFPFFIILLLHIDAVMPGEPLHHAGREDLAWAHAQGIELVVVGRYPVSQRLGRYVGTYGQLFSCHCFHRYNLFLCSSVSIRDTSDTKTIILLAYRVHACAVREHSSEYSVTADPLSPV